MIGSAAVAWRTRVGGRWRAWLDSLSKPVRIATTAVIALPTIAALDVLEYSDPLEGVFVALWTGAALCVFLLGRSVVRRLQRRRGYPDWAPTSPSSAERRAAAAVMALVPALPILAAVLRSPWWLLALPSALFIALVPAAKTVAGTAVEFRVAA